MRSEKYILSILIITLFGYSRAQAQSSTDGSNDKVSLSIVLYPIQTIVINQSQKQVDLEYISKDDYQNGVVSDQNDHITVYSTGGFDINVESAGEHLIGVSKNISVKDVKIIASKGSKNELEDVAYGANVVLSTATTGLVRSGTGGVGQTFNVRYESAGDDMYINHYDDGSEPTTFTTTVTYSIIAQ